MNRCDSGRFRTESVESAAKRYKTLGFSIIPLLGARNSQQPKLPAIKWARFQHIQPTDEELHSWFADQPDAGIGIVCGRISRLMVLDFDDALVASEFRRLHPELVGTYTVRSGTRGLPHFYYRLPESKLITTSAYPGVDLRAEGAYVVAPPTTVGDASWIVENDAPIHDISEFELRLMMHFLVALKPVEVPSSKVDFEAQSVQVSEFRHLPQVDELIAFYQQLCGLGRNQALFKTAVLARDNGVSEAAFTVMLAPIHARQTGTVVEDYGSRYDEAIRTISSTYKRPPCLKANVPVRGLGNAVREWFLTNGFTALARVIDGLYAVGMKPNERFTELEACRKLAALKIGRRSIMAALKCKIDDLAVFDSSDPPLNPPITANAANRSDDLNHSCEMSRSAMRVKNAKRGRPARTYRLPSPGGLSEKTGVKNTASDGIPTDHFVSPGTYRQALHMRLLERRPGHYARVWLAQRLGVSRWTTRRYEKAANLVVQPSYATQAVSWSSAATLPQTTTETAYGVFLEASNGKRYPAIRGLALRLLKQGLEPVLKQQQANYYAASPASVGIPTPQYQTIFERPRSPVEKYADSSSGQSNSSVGIPTASNNPDANNPHASSHQMSPGVGIPTPPTPEPTFWLCPDCLDFHVTVNRPDLCTRCGSKHDWEVLPPTIWRDAQALKHWWQQRYRDHQQAKHERALGTIQQTKPVFTPEANRLVERVRTQIPNLSLANARQIVQQFSARLIEKALMAVRTRTNLRSPAGFLIAFLKSEQKLLSSNNKLNSAVEKRESSITWVKRLAKSKYLSFLANADDIVNLNLGDTNDPLPA